MADERCAPGRHLGEGVEGRCSFCGDQIERPSLWLVLLVLVAVTAAVVLAVRILLALWLST